MEDAGWAPERVQQALAEARRRDHSFAAGQIVGSMCTEPAAIAAQAYAQFLPTNLGDPDHFPGTAALERDVLADIAALTSGKAAGVRFLTGGTEANLLACYLAREVTGNDRIVVSDAAHFSFEKAARLLRMELVKTPVGADLRSDPGAMADAAEGAAMFVAIAGSTELGLVDDVAAIAKVARGSGTHCHVDAAFGGYVLPFLGRAAPWDLRVAGVTSVGLDPHKMGQAPVPAGALAVREPAWWDRIAVETGYVSTDSQSTLMGTRPGAAVAATWAIHRAMGREGYARAVAACLNTTKRLADDLAAAGAELVAPPELNVVTFRFGDVAATQARLAKAGFRCNLVPRLGALRVVVGPHVTDDVADGLMAALERA